MEGLDNLAEKVAENAVRAAAGLPPRLDDVPEPLRGLVAEAVERLAGRIARIEEDGSITCLLCGKARFTRQGYYLHARRVHMQRLKELAKNLLTEALLAPPSKGKGV